MNISNAIDRLFNRTSRIGNVTCDLTNQQRKY